LTEENAARRRLGGAGPDELPGVTTNSRWQPRVVALDIDGTVVGNDGELPVRVRDAVCSVLSAGVPVVLATGRSWHGVRSLVQELGLPPGRCVCSNGAVIVSYPPDRLARVITFDPRPVIEKVVAHAPEALIAVEEIGRGYRLTSEFPGDDLTGEMIIEDAEQLSSRPVTRVIVRDPARSDEEFLALAEQLGLHGVSYYVGWSAWLDIAPSGVSKASGLAEVVAELGVKAADVLAVGDGRNDVEMLSWAGRGVAMGQAPPEVIAAADDVTGSFDEGGLVSELRRWFG
jgi:5-amino-6-(5-phospho-D-ribitylamino)uracil phosphatase